MKDKHSNEARFEPSNRLKDHDPQDFIFAYHKAECNEARGAVRSKLKRIDGGRWYDVLDKAHRHLAHSDIQGKNNLKVVYGREFKAWIGVYGLVEDLNTMESFTGVFRND